MQTSDWQISATQVLCELTGIIIHSSKTQLPVEDMKGMKFERRHPTKQLRNGYYRYLNAFCKPELLHGWLMVCWRIFSSTLWLLFWLFGMKFFVLIWVSDSRIAFPFRGDRIWNFHRLIFPFLATKTHPPDNYFFFRTFVIP